MSDRRDLDETEVVSFNSRLPYIYLPRYGSGKMSLATRESFETRCITSRLPLEMLEKETEGRDPKFDVGEIRQ